MSAEGRGSIGLEGRFRFVRHDVQGLRGSGPDGAVVFEDLWKVDQHGKLCLLHPERVLEDRTQKNKFLRRGSAYILKTFLDGNTGTDVSKHPPEITYPGSGTYPNPFQALILVGDNALVTPSRPGDAKVAWNESDGQWDAKIPGTAPDTGSGTAQIGRRGIRLSDTSGTYFKRVQIRYPNASPNYEECEYTFFAKANVSAYETGDDGLDNFIIKSFGLCTQVPSGGPPWIAPGFNEAYSQWGLRAVLGLGPTFQGKTDRVYVHEWWGQGDGSAGGQGTVPGTIHANGSDGSPKYLATESIDGDGYVSSYEPADASLLTYTGVSITITVATKLIQVTGAAFTSAHVRKTLKIRNMTTGLNNIDYKIKRVVGGSGDTVEVFETPNTSETDPSADAELVTRTTGIQAFDGRVENEGLVGKGAFDADASGAIIQGEKWVSQDVPGGSTIHYVGRIWNSAKNIKGVRIVFPKGSIRDFCPNRFVVQTLTSGNPEGGTWTTQTLQVDTSANDQAANIFDNGEYGYEYYFSSPVSTQGLRVANMIATDGTRKVEVGELYIYESMSSITITTGSNDKLKLSTDGGSVYRTYTCPAVSATTSIQTICDALNRVLYGYGIEAVRSTFGYLLLRGSGGGNYSQLHQDTVANSIYSALGLPTSGFPVAKTGVTQPLVKAYTDALTLIYTPRMSGNLPRP